MHFCTKLFTLEETLNNRNWRKRFWSSPGGLKGLFRASCDTLETFLLSKKGRWRGECSGFFRSVIHWNTCLSPSVEWLLWQYSHMRHGPCHGSWYSLCSIACHCFNVTTLPVHNFVDKCSKKDKNCFSRLAVSRLYQSSLLWPDGFDVPSAAGLVNGLTRSQNIGCANMAETQFWYCQYFICAFYGNILYKGHCALVDGKGGGAVGGYHQT